MLSGCEVPRPDSHYIIERKFQDETAFSYNLPAGKVNWFNKYSTELRIIKYGRCVETGYVRILTLW